MTGGRQLRKLADEVVREPVSVVVAGNSASLFVVPPRRRRDEGTYGELLPGRLAAAGVRATVTHTGKWFDMVHELRRRYETAVRNHFPDVLVLNYGMAECQPEVVPTWLVRHFTTWNRSSHPVALRYRDSLSPPVWRYVRRWQQVAAGRVGPSRTHRLAPQRFSTEMERVIRMAREDIGCLVLVLDLDPPGERVCHWMPGLRERWRAYQQILADLVADLADPEVRLVAASRTVADLGVDVALPDGLHRTSVGHSRTAALLGEEILRWLDAEPRAVVSGPTMAERPVVRLARRHA